MSLVPGGGRNNPNLRSEIVPEVNEKADPLTESDEYGTELHREARVWKVYVKEADRYDTELVKEWNDSTDVILIFAALFSAISTAFLIESSKMLQKDPLVVISETLLSMANNTRPPGSTPSNNDSTDFTPSRTAIWVNTLWYLSLSLSLATSFIAILAKDWCRSFMANRTGHPFEQTCRRQQKWDMIARWKMSELLTVLPSLIHVALFLFAIGLCIVLWDTHIVVALPVICVSAVALGFYVSSSIAAIFVDSFPYPTIISRICRTQIMQILWRVMRELPFVLGLVINLIAMLAFWILCIPLQVFSEIYTPVNDFRDRILAQNQQLHLHTAMLLRPVVFFLRHTDRLCDWVEHHIWNAISKAPPEWFIERIPTVVQGLKDIFTRLKPNDMPSEDEKRQLNNSVTGQALSWLITYCEVPQSVDIALQSIAGATNRISRQPLLDCQAPLEILRRLASSNLYKGLNNKSNAVVSLYTRALSFLGTSTSFKSNKQTKTGSELEASIWDLQMEIEKKLAALIVDGNFEPSGGNLDALRIGSTAASISLKVLQKDLKNADTRKTFDIIIELLQSHLDNANILHDAALLSLTHAATLLLLFAPASVAAPHNDSISLPKLQMTSGNFPELSGECDFTDAHVLLSLCIQLAGHYRSSGLVSSLATTCVLLYNLHVHRRRTNQTNSLTWFEEVMRGLIERYSQDEETLKLMYGIELPGISTTEEEHDLEGYISRLDNHFLSIAPTTDPTTIQTHWTQFGRKASRDAQENITSSMLQALHRIYHLTSVTTLNPAIYVFVIEYMCQTQNPSSLVWSTGTQLLSQCRFPTPSRELTSELERRNLVSLLEKTSSTNKQTRRFFANGQLWLLLSHRTYPQDGSASGDNELHAQLAEYGKRHTEDNPHELKSLGEQLHKAWLEDGDYNIDRALGVWVYRLLECVCQSLGDPLHQIAQDGLRNVPAELRGLSSFTGWQPQADDAPTDEAQKPEELVVDAQGDADAANLSTSGGHVTGSGERAPDTGLALNTAETRTQKAEGAARIDAVEFQKNVQVPVDLAGEFDGAKTLDLDKDGPQITEDERKRVDKRNLVEETDGAHLDGEKTENGNAGHSGGGEGDVSINMGGLDERSS